MHDEAVNEGKTERAWRVAKAMANLNCPRPGPTGSIEINPNSVDTQITIFLSINEVIKPSNREIGHDAHSLQPRIC